MRYQPSVFEQAKFDYALLGNIFKKGLDKDDQKEELYKRLENVKDKNEELLQAFSAANKVIKAAKKKSDFNYHPRYAFYNFYRVFERFKRMSLGSKYDEINNFYMILNAFINTHKATTTKTKNRKNKILNNVNQLYNDYFDVYKENYYSENLNERDEKILKEFHQFKILGKKSKNQIRQKKIQRERVYRRKN